MKLARRDRGVTTVEWVIVAMVIGVGCIAVFRTFKDSYMAPATNRMGDCIEAAAGDGNLCGGLATGGAATGGGGNAAGGTTTGGALAQNGNGVGGNGATSSNGVGGNGTGGNSTGGNGMSAGDLVNSVGGGPPGAATGGGIPAGAVASNTPPAHGENPNAGIANAVSNGFSLEQAAEDALINATKNATGTEIPAGIERAIGLTRAGVGVAVGVPLDVVANGVPHTAADAASLATKTAIVGVAGYFGGPVGAVAAVGLDKSLGYISDSITGGTRYESDYQDSIAWRMAHGQAGTIGKEGLEAEQANEQRMLHEQLDYMHQQQQRDAEALREMMPH